MSGVQLNTAAFKTRIFQINAFSSDFANCAIEFTYQVTGVAREQYVSRGDQGSGLATTELVSRSKSNRSRFSPSRH